MYELFRSPKTAGLISALPVSLLFHHSPNLNVSCRQVSVQGLARCRLPKSNLAGLTFKFTLKLPHAAPRCGLHLHEGMPDSVAHYEEVENETGLENTDRL
jgi:hypothetical protein